MSNISVRRMQPDDWQLAREVRLAALTDSPAAFATRLTDALQLTEDVWRARLANSCTVVAFRGDDTPVGLAGCFVDEDGAQLVSMWVAPDARGSGVADALIDSVCAWAAEERHVTVALWVVERNEVAERVYARNGFVRTGRVKPARDGEAAMEFEMIRLLPE